MAVVSGAPVGTIALLFTDIEGSTRLAGELGAAWPGVLADHHAIVGGAIAEEGGFVDGTEGDSFFATFAEARAAVRAAVAALRRLRANRWPLAVGELMVRMGLHVGYVERNVTGYVGLEVHRAARVAGAANGGQLLITAPALALIGNQIDVQPLGAHRLKDFPVPELLFCGVVDGRGAAFFPPPRTQRVRPTNLPALAGDLVGRERELERIRDLVIEGASIVTVTGRGGAGKTSLALTAAAGLLDQHPGGVWLVSLAAVSSREEVLPAVSGVLGVKGARESLLDAVAGHLTGRGRTLIVLDNFEHLLPAVGSIAALAEAAPELRLLITSQAPLRITRERCVAIDSLEEGAAIALIERVAHSRDASFRLAGDDRAVLAEIVSILDGLPLALELAGAHLRLLAPSQLRDRLRDSAEVLRNEMRDRPDRHRSLRAAAEWTLATLGSAARELFVRIGAFAGAVELGEVEAVVGVDGLDVSAAMFELLDRALVRRIEAGDGRVRLGLPEALRQIAAGLLRSSPDGERWQRQHAQRQCELQWAARNCWVPEPVYRAAISADTEAAAALHWSKELNDPLAAPLAAARARLLCHEGRLREAVAVIPLVLDSLPSDGEVLGQAQIANALTLGTLGRREEALEAANAAVELVTEPESRASALAVRALEHLLAGDTEAALSDHEAATGLARHLDPVMLSEALFLESQARMQAGQLDLAVELIEEAVEVGQRGDSPHLWGRHSFEGDLAVLRGRPREALGHYSVALERAQAHHDHVQVYMDLCGLAEALVMNRSDIEALEVCGLAKAQITDAGAAPGSTFVGEDFQRQAQERIGARAAAEATRRGEQVDAGYRVTRACELARTAGAPAPRSPGLEPASGQ